MQSPKNLLQSRSKSPMCQIWRHTSSFIRNSIL
jgi:hypothetical protein